MSTKQVMKNRASITVDANKVILDNNGNFPSNRAVCICTNLNMPVNVR